MNYTAAVITVSDKGFRGERADTSGPALCRLLRDSGWDVTYTCMVPDEADQIREELIRCADEKHVQLVLTTGGTGFSPRDVTPEATLTVVERETRGIPEAMRAESLKITPRGCLSRAAAGIRGRTLMVNLPGSEKAAVENLLAVLGSIGRLRPGKPRPLPQKRSALSGRVAERGESQPRRRQDRHVPDPQWRCPRDCQGEGAGRRRHSWAR